MQLQAVPAERCDLEHLQGFQTLPLKCLLLVGTPALIAFHPEVFTAAVDFLMLEKIEIGGPKGKILNKEIHCMNEEFNESWKTLQESKYDPLDYNNQEFLSDYTRNIWQINDFDHRLGTILNLAFQQSKGLESSFKDIYMQSFAKASRQLTKIKYKYHQT
ncbi:Dynein heavy chain 11, axonemal [Varanus komodoensis]|nr:Dynein heavy chain 11, axonemal [Varanus komodoensis]